MVAGGEFWNLNDIRKCEAARRPSLNRPLSEGSHRQTETRNRQKNNNGRNQQPECWRLHLRPAFRALAKAIAPAKPAGSGAATMSSRLDESRALREERASVRLPRSQ